MHLGMSGSFRVAHDEASATPGAIPSRARARIARTITSCSTCRRARRVTFNDPRRFGFMDLVPRDAARPAIRCCARSAPSRSATRSTPPCWRAACRARRPPEGGAARPDGRRRPRQHLCLRGLLRARLSPKRKARPSRRDPARRTSAPSGWSRRSGGARRRRSRPAARRCATTARPPANSAISSTGSASTIARASRARRCGCTRHDQAHRTERPLDLLLRLPTALIASADRPASAEHHEEGRNAHGVRDHHRRDRGPSA